MRTKIRCALVLICALLWTPVTHAQEFSAPIEKMVLEDGDSIVFLGDSITHQCLYTQYVEDYFYTRFPNLQLKVHNAGVGGARAWDALARFGDDVADFKPKYVTILLGMNDGSYQPFNQEIFDTYRQDMTTLLEKLDGIGAKSILMTPTMFDSRAVRLANRQRDPEMLRLYNSVLTYYGTWLREVAVDEGRGFVDMWGPLNNITLEQRKTDPKFTMIADSIHPVPNGQVVMATAIVNDMGLPRQVSNIQIVGGGSKPVVRSSGGKLTELSWGESEVSFIWEANSLPWVLPEEAQLGVKLTRLGHRLSREALEVHGLAEGKYQLTIDGEVVGTYQSAQLERHVELQENSKTPQYQQALRVAELNKQRNEGPVRALRNEWSQFQRYARAKRAADAAPDNAELAKQLAAATEKVEGMPDRVDEKIEAADEIEKKILEVNEPPLRKYVLKKVE